MNRQSLWVSLMVKPSTEESRVQPQKLEEGVSLEMMEAFWAHLNALDVSGRLSETQARLGQIKQPILVHDADHRQWCAESSSVDVHLHGECCQPCSLQHAGRLARVERETHRAYRTSFLNWSWPSNVVESMFSGKVGYKSFSSTGTACSSGVTWAVARCCCCRSGLLDLTAPRVGGPCRPKTSRR